MYHLIQKSHYLHHICRKLNNLASSLKVMQAWQQAPYAIHTKGIQ
jgi:hypothetical protein